MSNSNSREGADNQSYFLVWIASYLRIEKLDFYVNFIGFLYRYNGGWRIGLSPWYAVIQSTKKFSALLFSPWISRIYGKFLPPVHDWLTSEI